MKTGFILMMLFNLLFAVFCTWTVVEFILYLVKDDPFHWLSLGLTVGALVGAAVTFIKLWLDDN